MNKFYDLVLSNYKNYERYNQFLQEKQLELIEKRKENSNLIEEIVAKGEVPDDAIIQDVSDKIYDYHAEEVLYKQDCVYLFFTLYLSVKLYLQLDDMMVLPKEVTELCQNLEHTIQKPYFVIELEKDKLSAKEIEKGRADKQKDYFKTDEVKNIQQFVMNNLIKELDKNKE